MLKESFFCMLVLSASGKFSKLWAGSFIRAVLSGDSGLSADDTILGRLVALLNKVCAAVGKKTAPSVQGSFVCGVLFKSLYPIVALTLTLVPVVPTKYILALCMTSIVLFAFKWIFSGEIKLSFELTDFFIVLFALLLVFSVFISYIPSNSAVMASVYILFILFYFVVKNTINSKKKLRLVLWGLMLSGAFVSLFGIYQRFTGAYFTVTESWVDTEMFQDSVRIYSTLDNPNVLGEYLLFIVPMAYAGLYFSKYKFFPTAILALSSFCMLLTSSRGAWLGLIAAFGIYALTKDKKLILFGLVALLFMPLLMPYTILERFASIGNMNDSSTRYRLYIWLASLAMAKDYWPVGIGPGTGVFAYVFQKYAFSASYAVHSHNLFLQIIIDFGLLGLALFAAIMFFFYKGVLSKIGTVKDKFLSHGGAALCAGMTGYLVQGLTDNVWYNYRITAYFWVIVAIAGVFAKLMEDSNAEIIEEI